MRQKDYVFLAQMEKSTILNKVNANVRQINQLIVMIVVRLALLDNTMLEIILVLVLRITHIMMEYLVLFAKNLKYGMNLFWHADNAKIEQNTQKMKKNVFQLM